MAASHSFTPDGGNTRGNRLPDTDAVGLRFVRHRRTDVEIEGIAAPHSQQGRRNDGIGSPPRRRGPPDRARLGQAWGSTLGILAQQGVGRGTYDVLARSDEA